MKALCATPFLFAFAVPLIAVVGYFLGGWWTFLAIAYGYILQPIGDTIAGRRFEPTRPEERSYAHRVVLWLVTPVQLVLVGWGFWMVTSGTLTTVEAIGLTVSIGVSTGALGITAAHELVHRRNRFERGLGLVLLALASNLQFRVEHVHGHHRYVGTPEDPATARLGESLFAFIPRSFVGQHIAAFRTEAKRLARRGYARYGVRNRMLWYSALQIGLLATSYAVFGWRGLVFFAGQGYVGCYLLESVNYIEHYGLVRHRDASGKYEPLAAKHSWNANHRLTNWSLFNLGRHSSHHLNETAHFEGLGDSPDTPQLPAGYGASILLAMIPPLWRRVMDPRVAKANAA